MELEIPPAVLEYAKLTYQHYVPKRRYSGFQEDNRQIRGNGDLIALVAALTLHHEFGKLNKICTLELTSGAGDSKDLSILVKKQPLLINIKASAYAPYRPNLNLFVKEEELTTEGKKFDAYLQCFVHLAEDNLPPHMHVAGGCSTSSEIFKECKQIIGVIPNTGGHRGMKIPCERLNPFENLLQKADEKF